MENDEKIKVGISIGDLNGIGSEIILKTFSDSRILDFCTPIIFASLKTMLFYNEHFNIDINYHSINNLNDITHDKVNVLNIWKETPEVSFGQEEKSAGSYAVKSFTQAVKALKENAIDTLLTAPINKASIQSDDFKFPGHTDYLAQELIGDCMMLMVSGDLRVGLLTDHVPVKDVATVITPELIRSKINTIQKTLIQDFRISNPKIAVLGINPHTGDNGVIGTEDDTILRPTLKALKDEGLLVFGPYAADSFFGSNNYKAFDAIIASYHDQGLIPFKTLSFGQGVNFSAGLNRIRTSPDHGTAFEIAGKGVADVSSFKEALFTGLKIYKNRTEYQQLSKNKLKKQAVRYQQKNVDKAIK